MLSSRFQLWYLVAVAISTSALEVANDKNDQGLIDFVTKYLNKVPDIQPRYVVSEGLSQVLTRLMNGKISTFPLFRIALKIDRSPVKIPWSTDLVVNDTSNSTLPTQVKQYKLLPEPTKGPLPEPTKIAVSTDNEVVTNEAKNETKAPV